MKSNKGENNVMNNRIYFSQKVHRRDLLSNKTSPLLINFKNDNGKYFGYSDFMLNKKW